MSDLRTFTRRLVLKASPLFAGTALMANSAVSTAVATPTASASFPANTIFLRVNGHSLAIDPTATEILVGECGLVCDADGALRLFEGPMEPADPSRSGRKVLGPPVDHGIFTRRSHVTLIGRVIAGSAAAR